MRADRLVSLLLLLQTRERQTAAQLAQALEVSQRTVYRDIEALLVAGVPLYAESGAGGGYRLVQGYRTRLTGLTRQEAQAISLAGLPGPAADLGLGAVAARAQLKVAAALPPELAEHARVVGERVHLDTSTWYRAPDDLPHLTTIAEATWSQRVVEIRYRRWHEPREVSRSVAPLGLVLKSGAWYLVGSAGGRVSTFRVGEVLEASLTDTSFERPAGFDLASHWRASVAAFERRQQLQGEATLVVSERGYGRLIDQSSQAVASAASETALPARLRGRPGWRRVVVPIESIDHATSFILGLGIDVEVLTPAALRSRVAADVRRLAERYGERTGASPGGPGG